MRKEDVAINCNAVGRGRQVTACAGTRVSVYAFFLSVMALFWVTASTSAAPATYLLKRQIISDHETRVSIYNAQTGRTVWTKKLVEVDNDRISWTPDHRAVAMVDAGDSNGDGGISYRIVIWKAGNRVRTISKIPLPSRYRRSLVTSMRDDLLGVDDLLQIALSPNKKRLLVRASVSQGPGTLDAGELWCLTLSSSHVQQLNQEVQGDAHWLDSRTVRFVRFRFVTRPDGSNFPNGSPIKLTRANVTMRVQ